MTKKIKPVGAEAKNIKQEKTKEEVLEKNIELCSKLAIEEEKTKILTNPSLNKDQLHMLMECEIKNTHTFEELDFMSKQEHWMVISSLSNFFKKGESIAKAKEILSKNLHPIQTSAFLGLSHFNLSEHVTKILIETSQDVIDNKAT
jgi:hypothetical protein